MRPARAKPTFSLRCSIDVEPELPADDELHRLAHHYRVVSSGLQLIIFVDTVTRSGSSAYSASLT